MNARRDPLFSLASQLAYILLPLLDTTFVVRCQEQGPETPMKFVIIPELKGRWIWELRTADGVAVARSPQTFGEKAQAIAMIQKVRLAVHRARVYDPVGASMDDGR